MRKDGIIIVLLFFTDSALAARTIPRRPLPTIPFAVIPKSRAMKTVSRRAATAAAVPLAAITLLVLLVERIFFASLRAGKYLYSNDSINDLLEKVG